MIYWCVVSRKGSKLLQTACTSRRLFNFSEVPANGDEEHGVWTEGDSLCGAVGTFKMVILDDDLYEGVLKTYHAG